jgi:Ribosomal protein L36e
VVREVAGWAPYERRVMELLKVGKDKRALKVCCAALWHTLPRGAPGPLTCKCRAEFTFSEQYRCGSQPLLNSLPACGHVCPCSQRMVVLTHGGIAEAQKMTMCADVQTEARHSLARKEEEGGAFRRAAQDASCREAARVEAAGLLCVCQARHRKPLKPIICTQADANSSCHEGTPVQWAVSAVGWEA